MINFFVFKKTFQPKGLPQFLTRRENYAIYKYSRMHALKIQEEIKLEGDRKTLVLPYITGLSENISSSCRGLPVRVSFSSRFTLRSSLTKLKDPIPTWDGTGVIYSIPCCYVRSYIGETGRSLITHLSKQKKSSDLCPC